MNKGRLGGIQTSSQKSAWDFRRTYAWVVAPVVCRSLRRGEEQWRASVVTRWQAGLRQMLTDSFVLGFYKNTSLAGRFPHRKSPARVSGDWEQTSTGLNIKQDKTTHARVCCVGLMFWNFACLSDVSRKKQKQNKTPLYLEPSGHTVEESMSQGPGAAAAPAACCLLFAFDVAASLSQLCASVRAPSACTDSFPTSPKATFFFLYNYYTYYGQISDYRGDGSAGKCACGFEGCGAYWRIFKVKIFGGMCSGLVQEV